MSGARLHAFSGSPYETTYGFSRAVRVGAHVAVAGTAPILPDGSCAPDAASQARRCFQIILEALAEVGGQRSDVVRTRMFIVDPADGDAVGAVHGEVFAGVQPAATMVAVAALLQPEWRVEIEADAIVEASA